MGRLLALVLGLATIVPVARANTLGVPLDYPTIQAAIDAAVDGDTVLVEPASYVELINFKGKAILVTSSGGASVTTIDGNMQGPVVTFWTSETSTSVLSGFTITHGVSEGGISCYQTQPTIRDCIISANSSNAGGGGIRAFLSAPTIENNLITGNSAPRGGAVYSNSSSAPLIRGNTIRDNTAFNQGAGRGGGIFCSDGNEAIIEGNTIEHNSSDRGGGIFCQTSDIQVINNLITGNEGSSAYGGGGLYVEGGRVTIQSNTISFNSSGFGGGGIACSYAVSATIVNNTITQNSAAEGGGLFIDSTPGLVDHNVISANDSSDRGGGVYLAEEDAFVFSNNVISDNSAASDGGGLWYSPYLTVPGQIVTGNVFSGNRANRGGGVFLFSASSMPVLTSNCVFANTATLLGGGIYGDSQVLPTISLCTVSGNQATIGGGVDVLAGTIIENTILWDNHASGSDPEIHGRHGDPEVTYSDVEGGFAGSGNIDLDPLFSAPAQGDFSLTRSSPCVDQGDPASRPSDRDAAGNARLLDGGLIGALRVDMGAYEYTNVRFDVSGQPSPGQTLTLSTHGLPGLLVILLIGRSPGEIVLPPYGPLFFDLAGGFMAQPLFVIPGSGEVILNVMVPTTISVPLALVLQELALNQFDATGNVSDSVAITIE